MKARTNTNKKNSTRKKLIPAAGSLLISAAMLGTSTYAWFTMNKEVQVKGMQLKAHSEEGLLINEVKAAGSETWDNEAQATASPTAYALRPASTYNLNDWWHANSKISHDEAGIDNLASGTVPLGSGAYYRALNDTATDYTVIGDENATSGAKAIGNDQAETHVFYTDASFGSGSGYDDGEGFYVKYIYYLKSSGEADLTVKNLSAQVKATKINSDTSGTSTELDKSLRVGIAVPANVSATAGSYAGSMIFAPVNGADDSYDVTTANTGATHQSVNPVDAATTGNFTDYAQINKGVNGAGSVTNVTIPKVTSNGLPVYVYIWFEGEDQACMSDNLTTVLDSYQIDINFKDVDIEAY